MYTRVDPIVRHANETVISIVTQLKECYSFISKIQLVDNYEWMVLPYVPSHPIKDLFEQMQDGQAYTKSGEVAFGLIFNTGIYNEAFMELEK
jgi:hypothetical protein